MKQFTRRSGLRAVADHEGPTPPECSEVGLAPPGYLTEERVAEIAKALAHPVRIKIVELFYDHRCRMAKDVVAECDLAQSTVSEHLRILREAGVLFARRQGIRTWYCLRRSVVRQFAHQVEDLALDAFLAGRDGGPEGPDHRPVGLGPRALSAIDDQRR